MFLGALKHNLFLWAPPQRPILGFVFLGFRFRVFFFFGSSLFVFSFPPSLIECFVIRFLLGFHGYFWAYQGFIVILGYFLNIIEVPSLDYVPTVCALFISFRPKMVTKQFISLVPNVFPSDSHGVLKGLLKLFPIPPQIYHIWFAQSSILMYIK